MVELDPVFRKYLTRPEQRELSKVLECANIYRERAKLVMRKAKRLKDRARKRAEVDGK